MKWKTKNGMKDLELKNSFIDEELPDTMKSNPTPTCFSRWYDIQKYYYHGKIPLPIQLPKEDKKTPKQHPLKWAKFTDENRNESTMVV